MKIVRGWIDTAGRCRTWRLLDANGEAIAEITTLKGARELFAALTTQLEPHKPLESPPSVILGVSKGDNDKCKR